MNKTYERINWENYPSDKTPLNEQNLNEIDAALDEVDNRVIMLDNTKATKTEISSLFKEVFYDEQTGIITFTRKNGATITIDTPMEKIALNIYYDPVTEMLTLPLIDGTQMEVDLSRLITEYEFTDSDTIAFSVSTDGKVTAIVKEGSIEEKHLRPDYLADIKVESAKAQSAAVSAENGSKESLIYAKQSMSYAVGTGDARPNETIDNAKYYSEQAKETLESLQNMDIVTGVKGDNESSYRIGDVNITPENIGAISKNGGLVNGELALLGGAVVKRMHGSGGKAGYVNFAHIKITFPYVNFTVEFCLGGRGRDETTKISVLFQSENNVDPNLIYFAKQGDCSYPIYITKTSASNWDLFAPKSEPWGLVTLVSVNVVNPDIGEVTYPNILVTSVGEDWVEARIGGMVEYAYSLGTRNETGGLHGKQWPLQCQFNRTKDSCFDLYCSNGKDEHRVKAGKADRADNIGGLPGTGDTSRHIWFSDTDITQGGGYTKRAYDDNFTYNPATKTMSVRKIKISGEEEFDIDSLGIHGNTNQSIDNINYISATDIEALGSVRGGQIYYNGEDIDSRYVKNSNGEITGSFDIYSAANPASNPILKVRDNRIDILKTDGDSTNGIKAQSVAIFSPSKIELRVDDEFKISINNKKAFGCDTTDGIYVRQPTGKAITLNNCSLLKSSKNEMFITGYASAGTSAPLITNLCGATGYHAYCGSGNFINMENGNFTSADFECGLDVNPLSELIKLLGVDIQLGTKNSYGEIDEGIRIHSIQNANSNHGHIHDIKIRDGYGRYINIYANNSNPSVGYICLNGDVKLTNETLYSGDAITWNDGITTEEKQFIENNTLQQMIILLKREIEALKQ